MYVKGTIENPEITKIVRIVKGDSSDISMIQERIIKNEYQRKPLPYETIEKMYGEEYLRLDNRRNNASFRQYRVEQEGRSSQESNTFGRGEQDAAGSQKENNATSEAGLNKPAFCYIVRAKFVCNNINCL